mgnify:CR=1 FL=1
MDIELSPCSFNISLFRSCISKQRQKYDKDYTGGYKGVHMVGAYDCRHWPKDAIVRCENVARGGCGK